MQQVILDQSMCQKFGNVTELVELRDQSGHLLGHYVPASSVSEKAGTACPHNDQEIDRLRQQTGGRTLAEIWKDLGLN